MYKIILASLFALSFSSISYAAPVFTPSQTIKVNSSAIGGSALSAGQCTTATTTVTGASVGMAVAVSPQTYPGDAVYWKGYVSSANTVTINVCAAVAATPVSSVYTIRVIQ